MKFDDLGVFMDFGYSLNGKEINYIRSVDESISDSFLEKHIRKEDHTYYILHGIGRYLETDSLKDLSVLVYIIWCLCNRKYEELEKFIFSIDYNKDLFDNVSRSLIGRVSYFNLLIRICRLDYQKDVDILTILWKNFSNSKKKMYLC